MATRWFRSAAFGATLVAATAFAAVDVELRNGDKVTGTIFPATETETFRFRVPKDALLTVKAAAGRKGPQVRVQLKSPAGDLLPFAEGKTASITKYKAPESGLYSVEITSKDHLATGDYSFAVVWKSATAYGGKLALAAATPLDIPFSADAGATATLTVKKARKSAADPSLATLTYPDLSVEALTGSTQKRLLDRTGDCVLSVASAAAGDVTATVKIKPPRSSNRKYALTKKAIGGLGGDDGDSAFSSIVGPGGGQIVFPAPPPGQPGAELAGSAVLVPPGALPVGTSIVIATSPDIPTLPSQAGAGATVAFGPDGLVFGTKANPQSATITIPFDPTFGETTDDITIFTRNAKGVVTPVPKPYDFDLVANTVSFQSSHFSSFRAISNVPLPTGGNFFTVASTVDARDVCNANDPVIETQSLSLFYVAEGSGRTVGSIYFDGTATLPPYKHRTWVGGGTDTTLPAGRTTFQFTEDVNTVFATTDGTLFVGTRSQIFRVDPTTGEVTLVAGTGSLGDSGDGGAAVDATFTNIRNIVADENGGMLVVDDGAHRIRFISLSDNDIIAWAGNGSFGVGADGGSIATTSFIGPTDVSFAPDGGFYVADGARIRHINPFGATGPVNVTVAGDASGGTGSTGDDGAPTDALFEIISGISQYIDPQAPVNDKLAVVDAIDHTLRVVDFSGGTVRLFAGAHGTPGFSGDFGTTPGRLRTPTAVATLPGIFCIADKGNLKVRLLLASGL